LSSFGLSGGDLCQLLDTLDKFLIEHMQAEQEK
jgi:hypothetical protein